MSEETKPKVNTETSAKPMVGANGKASASPSFSPKKTFTRNGGGRRPRGGARPERQKPEFDQKIIDIRRVTRVVAGGRRFSFSVAVVIGNRRGAVGVGIGKAGDTSLAIQKAFNDAKRNMVSLKLDDNHSISHEVDAKYNSARIAILPNFGRGVVAGSAVRSVIELAGMRDVTSKVLSRSKNKLNIARATMKALAVFASPYKNKKAEPKKDEGAESSSKSEKETGK